MSTWVLIFYMSTSSFTSFATGGPAVIDGFTSQEKCAAMKSVIDKHQKTDWSLCVEVKK